MKNNVLIITGSARKEGNTAKFVHFLCTDVHVSYTVADLEDYTITPYNYNGLYPEGDGFNGLVKAMQNHDTIVLATPVYWYSMSGSMKTFFDRLTDLVSIQKQDGRKLKGKQVIVVAAGSDAGLPEGFEVPFKKTAHYFNMLYKGVVYHSEKNVDYKITDRVFFKEMLGKPEI